MRITLLFKSIVAKEILFEYNIQRGLTGTGKGGLHPIQLSATIRQMDAHHWRRKQDRLNLEILTENILLLKYKGDVSTS